jgi:predicted flavoprotein YhiN
LRDHIVLKVGAKILISGGGRCNFTNPHSAPDRFLSGNTDFCKSALGLYTQADFISLVERHCAGDLREGAARRSRGRPSIPK